MTFLKRDDYQLRLPKEVMNALTKYNLIPYASLNKTARDKIEKLLAPYGFKVSYSNEGYFELRDDCDDLRSVVPNVITFTFKGGDISSRWIMRCDGPGFNALDCENNVINILIRIHDLINQNYNLNSLNQLSFVEDIDKYIYEYNFVRDCEEDAEFINGVCVLTYRRPYIDQRNYTESISVALNEDGAKPTVHYALGIY